MTAVDDALGDLRTSASRIGSLSDRQEEVLHLLVLDLSNQQVADHLGITERTVKAHVAALMDRLGVHSRLRLAMVALYHRMTTVPADNGHDANDRLDS
ncbi:LuxR C-terminal-related transcriptional regulator [Kitasatospora sp. NPDC059463]|uniref:LuxR C-terminal-related transcriptional regulator n=1 Tax=unclassified Kitasatospora TaxID=2633591 RepID=UPI0036BA4DC9